jgi:hypothetical protein
MIPPNPARDCLPAAGNQPYPLRDVGPPLKATPPQPSSNQSGSQPPSARRLQCRVFKVRKGRPASSGRPNCRVLGGGVGCLPPPGAGPAGTKSKKGGPTQSMPSDDSLLGRALLGLQVPKTRSLSRHHSHWSGNPAGAELLSPRGRKRNGQPTYLDTATAAQQTGRKVADRTHQTKTWPPSPSKRRDLQRNLSVAVLVRFR